MECACAAQIAWMREGLMELECLALNGSVCHDRICELNARCEMRLISECEGTIVSTTMILHCSLNCEVMWITSSDVGSISSPYTTRSVVGAIVTFESDDSAKGEVRSSQRVFDDGGE